MDWQILTTFFSFASLMVGVLVLMAQTHVKRSQITHDKILTELQDLCNSMLSIVREMDKQQDLFVRQMPPHKETVAPMDTEDAPEGYKWLTLQSQEDVAERFSVEPQILPKKLISKKGIKRGPYKKRVKPHLTGSQE